MTTTTPPAPTLAPGRERVSVDRAALEVVRELADMGALYRAPGAVAGLIASTRPLSLASALPLAEYLTLADDLIAVRDETAGGGNRDTMTRAVEVIRILCAEAAALTATPAAPVAGTFVASFVEAVDVYEQTAFDHGAEYGADMSSERRRDDTAKEVRAARAALMDAHAAEVQAARAEGWAAAMAARALLAVIDAHEVVSLSCDRDGQEYCDCLVPAIAGLRAALADDTRECRCTFAQRVVGDGCAVCNPTMAAEIAAENAADDTRDGGGA